MAKGKNSKKGKAAPDTRSQELDLQQAVLQLQNEIDARKQSLDLDEWTWESYSIEVAPEKVAVGSKKSAKEKKPKKLSAKKQKELEKKLEQERKEALLAAQLAEEAERIRLAEEKKRIIAETIVETAQQQIREKQLRRSLKLIGRVRKYNLEATLLGRELDRWEHYVKCDGTPAVFDCRQMNVYLHLWQNESDVVTPQQHYARGREVSGLIRALDEIIADDDGVCERTMHNWKEVQRECRETLAFHTSLLTFSLLRNVSKYFERSGTACTYKMKGDLMVHSMWLQMQLPESGGGFGPPTGAPSMLAFMHRKRSTIARTMLDFTEMGLIVHLPIGMTCFDKAIVATYTLFDDLSDRCSTKSNPGLPPEIRKDLYKSTWSEWNDKRWYKFENRKKDKKKEPAMIVDRNAGIIPDTPYVHLDPTPNDYVQLEEDRLYEEIEERLAVNEPSSNVNLRTYTILGGIYSVELFHQVPQAVEIAAIKMTLTRLEIPTVLRQVSFVQEYNPPAVTDTSLLRKQEEIEEEQKRQEAELNKLLQITITLPNNVMFFDFPKVCRWDPVRLAWTTDYIYDVKNIEEKGQITFRSGKFGQFGLAINRYIDMPYQGWEMKPETDGSITLQITGAIVVVEFNVKEDVVALTQIQNAPNECLANLIGIYMKISKLIETIRTRGVDFFPDFDAMCYVKGVTQKHWPMEKHLYYNMAQLSGCYSFTWSRWNFTQERRKIVLQLRAFDPEKPRKINFQMTAISPLKAYFVECSEVYPTFEDVPVEDTVFCSDLFHLSQVTADVNTKIRIGKSDRRQVGTVADLLLATRICTYS